MDKSKLTISELVKKIKNSSFSKNNYMVNIDLDAFVDSMVSYTWDEKEHTKRGVRLPCDDKKFNKDWMEYITPGFQRSNKKWNKQMKQRFIENLLLGIKVELLLFRMSDYEDAKIIDGLQRTTAIIDFFDGKVKPFGFSYSDLKDDLKKLIGHNLTIKIYTFNEWKEVGKFYIDMNENITHSKSDIQKAKDWFLTEKNIML